MVMHYIHIITASDRHGSEAASIFLGIVTVTAIEK